jgi:hypothetical protein
MGKGGGQATPRGRLGWRSATPNRLRVAFGPPPGAWGWPRATPKGVAGPPLQLFFFEFFYKKISIFIYFLINLYFFITVDTCRHLIGDTWR